MKKELLFIMNNLNMGGAEKSLVSLLRTIDYDKYNVDLFLFKKEGALLNQVPEEVKILSEPEFYAFFDMSIKKAIVKNISKRNFRVVFYRLLAGLVYRTEKVASVREQKVWKYLKHVIKRLPKKYDVAIGYLEKIPNYFCIDKVDAKRRIGYVHTDYVKLKMCRKIDSYYFKEMDYIIAVSDACKQTLDMSFPSFKNKIKSIKNIVSEKTILSLAKEPLKKDFKSISILSVGRLSSVKGYDIAIRTCKILKDKDLDVFWYVIGDGEERSKLKQLIIENQLETRFILLGNKLNPYKYMNAADIFVHTARFEGYGLVINEAKILKKPILTTNFSSVFDQIQDNYNGLILEMNAFSVAKGLEKLILDNDLRKRLSENLSKGNFGTENEISKFYNLIDKV